MVSGLLAWAWWKTLLYTLITTHITIVSVTVYLHRYSAHRAVQLHPGLQHFFRFWLWLTTGMVTKEWTAIHRKHHAKCETIEDPHSPQVFGIKTVFWQGSELYRAASQKQDILQQYGRGTPDDWLEKNIYTLHSKVGVVLLLLINLTLFGALGLTAWAIQMLWIPVFAAGVINGIGHFWGYRNFESADASRNIVPWGILIGGEELHNNHHTYPNSAKLSCQWWEFDMGWFYIKLFSLAHLATAAQTPPVLHHKPGKHEIDTDTLKAFLANRFQIMDQYRRKVVAPLVATERHRFPHQAKPLFQRAKQLICSTSPFLDACASDELNRLFDASKALETAYQYRIKLQQIWEKTASNKNELIQTLADWCKDAEATGIHCLEDFAQRLKTFTVAPAFSPAD